MGKMYALFVSEEVLEPSMDNEMILTGVGHNKGRRLDRTLGALIKSDFAKKEILSEYMKIIDIIFCKLNIRNVVSCAFDILSYMLMFHSSVLL